MANEQSGIKFFVIYTVIIGLTCRAESDDGANFMDLAKTILQESMKNQNGAGAAGLAQIGSLVQGFMQSEGGKQIGSMLAGNNQRGAGDIISGLGSVLSAAAGGNNNGGFDPAMLGTVMNMFSSVNRNSEEDSDNNNIDENNNDDDDLKDKKRKKKKRSESDDSVNWEGMMDIAGNMLSSFTSGDGQKSGNSGGGGLPFDTILSFLPIMMQAMSGGHNEHRSANSVPHHQHEAWLPPMLENLHEYWDHFMNSDLGQAVWRDSGLMELVKQGKFFDNLENHSLRRKWVRGLSRLVAEWVSHLVNPVNQARYINNGQQLANGLLSTLGYPKSAHIDVKRPAESLSELSNQILKRQLGLEINSTVYIGPAVRYFQEVLEKTGKGIGMNLTKERIEAKLVETLDEEVLVPLVRVNRAYRYALKKPKCDRYVLCVISDMQNETPKVGLKPIVTKLSSLGASWLISTNSGSPIWDLLRIVLTPSKCGKYNRQCNSFLEEDIKATTEYYHNEL